MDVLTRIKKMRIEKGWTEYELAKRSGVPQSTISSWYTKNNQPSVTSLESICRGFGISLSQFFLEENSGEAVILDSQQMRLLNYASRLSSAQIDSLLEFLERLHPTHREASADSPQKKDA